MTDLYKAFYFVSHQSLVSKLERQIWQMDHILNKELAVWSHLKSGDQWLQEDFSQGHEMIGQEKG